MTKRDTFVRIYQLRPWLQLCIKTLPTKYMRFKATKWSLMAVQQTSTCCDDPIYRPDHFAVLNEIDKEAFKKEDGQDKRFKTLDVPVDRSILHLQATMDQELNEKNLIDWQYLRHEDEVNRTLLIHPDWAPFIEKKWRKFGDVQMVEQMEGSQRVPWVSVLFPTQFEATMAYFKLWLQVPMEQEKNVLRVPRYATKEPGWLITNIKKTKNYRLFALLVVAMFFLYSMSIKKWNQRRIFKKGILTKMERHREKVEATSYFRGMRSQEAVYDELDSVLQEAIGSMILIEGPRGIGKAKVIGQYLAENQSNFVEIDCKMITDNRHIPECIEKQLGFSSKIIWLVRQMFQTLDSISGQSDPVRLFLGFTGKNQLSSSQVKAIEGETAELKEMLAQLKFVLKDIQEDVPEQGPPIIYLKHFDNLLLSDAQDSAEKVISNSLLNTFMRWLSLCVKVDKFRIVIHTEGKYPLTLPNHLHRVFMIKHLYMLDPTHEEAVAFMKHYMDNHKETFPSKQDDEAVLKHIVKQFGTRPGDVLNSIRYMTEKDVYKQFRYAHQARVLCIQEDILKLYYSLSDADKKLLMALFQRFKELSTDCHFYDYQHPPTGHNGAAGDHIILLQPFEVNQLKGDFKLLHKLLSMGLLRILPSTPEQPRHQLIPYSMLHHETINQIVDYLTPPPPPPTPAPVPVAQKTSWWQPFSILY